MIKFVFLAVWYLFGLATLITWWRRDLDVALDDFIIILLAAVAGPFSLVLPFLSWAERKKIVVFKGKIK